MHLASDALKKRGHSVCLLHGQGATCNSATAYDGVISLPELFDFRSKLDPPGLPAAERRLDGWMRDQGIHLVHMHYPPRMSVVSRLNERHVVVLTAHAPVCPNGLRYLWKQRHPCSQKAGPTCLLEGFARSGCGRHPDGSSYSVLTFARKTVEDHVFRKTMSRLSRIVAPSRWAREQLVQDGVPADRIRVVHPPIVPFEENLSPVPAPAQGPPVVLFAGQLSVPKGAEDLVEASSLIRTPHRIWFVGDGTARIHLECLVRERRLGEQILFLGNRSPADLWHFRLQSQVAVVPSLLPETFCMVGPEAMQAGLPVVAYGAGGVSEWLEHGVTGRFVPPGDVGGLARALEHLLTHPSEARAMGEIGRLHSTRFSPSCHADRMAVVYAESVSAFERQRGGVMLEDAPRKLAAV